MNQKHEVAVCLDRTGVWQSPSSLGKQDQGPAKTWSPGRVVRTFRSGQAAGHPAVQIRVPAPVASAAAAASQGQAGRQRLRNPVPRGRNLAQRTVSWSPVRAAVPPGARKPKGWQLWRQDPSQGMLSLSGSRSEREGREPTWRPPHLIPLRA